MTVGQAIVEAYTHFALRSDRRPSAMSWERLPKDVRDVIASASSEEIGKVQLYYQRRVTPQRSLPLVLRFKP